MAAELGRTAVLAAEDGSYHTATETLVDWQDLVAHAVRSKVSIRPEDDLPSALETAHAATRVQVTNETTLAASQRLIAERLRPLALNFANGLHPGGGFLSGAKAQEEAICRSSALYATLVDDPMYDHHAQREEPDSTSWTILSPDVPVFRTEDGLALDEPWLLSLVTCAAPVASSIGQPRSGDLLQQRIHRVLAIAQAYGYSDLVLGAWGCGAFGNDSDRTARDFRDALVGPFQKAFSSVIFAITDWSPDRRHLGPFRDVWASAEGHHAQ
ncbi:MAG: TIGR02452 family protein [Phycisphaeraceae bacterium]